MPGLLRRIFRGDDLQEARDVLAATLEELSDVAPQATEILETGFDDATAVIGLPEKYRKRLRTSIRTWTRPVIQRLNEEIRRRERPIRIFPNDESARRLIGALLIEQHEAWIAGRHYLDLTDYYAWKRTQAETTLPTKAA